MIIKIFMSLGNRNGYVGLRGTEFYGWQERLSFASGFDLILSFIGWFLIDGGNLHVMKWFL